jgi:hypothetical protein
MVMEETELTTNWLFFKSQSIFIYWMNELRAMCVHDEHVGGCNFLLVHFLKHQASTKVEKTLPSCSGNNKLK